MRCKYLSRNELGLNNKIILEDMEDIFQRKLDWNILNGKSVFISGAYGMLASYIVFYLSYLSEYKNVDVKIIAQGRNIEKAQNRFGELFNKSYFSFISDNICEEITYTGKIDYIIHAAGATYPNMYSTNPVEVTEPNVLGTYYLLKLAKEKNSQGFLLFSSGDVYGKVEDSLNIDENTIGQVNQMDDHSCYSESKRMAETLAYCYFKEYSVPVKIARIGHTYGPTMDIDNDPRVFASFLKCILQKKNIEMLSDGSAKRPFCYLADAIAAYFTILFKGEDGQAYNVCNTSEFISMRELADIIVNLRKDIQLSVVYKKRNFDDTYVENKVNHDNLPSDNKLRQLGFEYHFTTETGMNKVYKCLKKL